MSILVTNADRESTMKAITTTDESDLTTTDNHLTTTSELDQNPAAVYLAGLSEGSRRTTAHALETIAEMIGAPDALNCNWAAMRFQHAALIRSKLAAEYAPATVNKRLSALRGVLKAAWKLGQMSAEDYHKAASVENVKGETIPAGRDLSSGEIAALLAACESDESPAGVRDAAIIGVMYGAGLRRNEVANLDVSDWNPATGRLTVRAGKRNKDRTAYILNGAGRAVEDWLDIRGREPGALFVPVNKGGKLQYRRMTTQALYNMLKRRAQDAGVDDFSPHDMRRTFVGDLLDAGADISTVAKMAGHASVNTTARYDRRPEEAKQRASKMLHIPYRGRK